MKLKKAKGKTMKYLFFDYDGTLAYNGKISEANIKALEKARAAGHKIFLHTGRSKANVPDEVFYDIVWDGMICGKGYMEYNGRVLFEYTLSSDVLIRALKYCDEKDVRILWEGVERVYSNRPNEWLVDIYEHLLAADSLRITNLQIAGPMPERDKALFSDVELCCFSGYSEISPKGITKSTGLKIFEKEIGVSHSDIIVFGDSENDLEMVEYAETSVIMNHAPSMLWKYAALRTDSDENGVAEGIEKILFNTK
ncbi:MAG: HAD-IIB family hydrolase [Ruminococcaceae bacterium]|nr:HAD-IIB family hydrolase [Oscillospiraceae bacterium]